MKSGLWHVTFDLTLEGETVRFWELSEVTQEHILECIKQDYYFGEIFEEEDSDQ